MAGIAANYIQQVIGPLDRILLKITLIDICSEPHHSPGFILHVIVGRKIQVAGGRVHGKRCLLLAMAEITVHLQCPVVRIHDTVQLAFTDVLWQHFKISESWFRWHGGGSACNDNGGDDQ